MELHPKIRLRLAPHNTLLSIKGLLWSRGRLGFIDGLVSILDLVLGLFFLTKELEYAAPDLLQDNIRDLSDYQAELRLKPG